MSDGWSLPWWATTLLGFLLGVAGTILTSILTNWLSLAEANIVYVGGETPPHVKLEMIGREMSLYARIQPKLQNRGFKRGHVDSVEIKPIGLSVAPERVDVTFLDRTTLRMWETREIRCDFVAVIRFRLPHDPPDPRTANQGYVTYEPGSTPPAADAIPPIQFGASLRGPDGRLIHWDSMTFHIKVSPPSSATPPGRTP